MRCIQEPTGPLMLNFDLEIHYGVTQKSYAVIFEILIFRDFSGGQSPTFCQKGDKNSLKNDIEDFSFFFDIFQIIIGLIR